MLSALTRESQAYHIGLAWMSLSYIFGPDESQKIMREQGGPKVLAAFSADGHDANASSENAVTSRKEQPEKSGNGATR